MTKAGQSLTIGIWRFNCGPGPHTSLPIKSSPLASFDRLSADPSSIFMNHHPWGQLRQQHGTIMSRTKIPGLQSRLVNTVEAGNNMDNFLWDTHNRDSIACPHGWAIGCPSWYNLKGSVQDCGNSNALAMELLQFFTKPPICHKMFEIIFKMTSTQRWNKLFRQSDAYMHT